MGGVLDRSQVVATLRRAGFVAPEEEADELLAAARSPVELAAMVERRASGEPTAWITGRADFGGVALHVDPGVYVPRWQTAAVARHALTHLPAGGVAVDLCTGSGAVAAFLADRRPTARVVATDLDRTAADCAARNGVEVHVGDLFDPLPASLRGTVDVIVAVAPYVPDRMLAFLPRDVVAHEPAVALRGGDDGLAVIERIIGACRPWLRVAGALVLEAGIDQVADVARRLPGAGLVRHHVIRDGDGDECGVCGSAGS